MRIPTLWILEMAEAIKANPNIDSMEFIGFYGNVLKATRTIKPFPRKEHMDAYVKEHGTEDMDYIDFVHNPED